MPIQAMKETGRPVATLTSVIKQFDRRRGPAHEVTHGAARGVAATVHGGGADAITDRPDLGCGDDAAGIGQLPLLHGSEHTILGLGKLGDAGAGAVVTTDGEDEVLGIRRSGVAREEFLEPLPQPD